MNRVLRWSLTATLALGVVTLAFLRGIARVTVVIVAWEPFDVMDDADDVVDEDEGDDVPAGYVNHSHGYVPAVK